MLTIEEYRANPCGRLSIPYYKAKTFTAPSGWKVIHHRDFHPESWPGWEDRPYFRLFHSLRPVPVCPLPAGYRLEQAEEADSAAIAALISLCYGFAMEEEKVRAWRQHPEFRPELWVKLSREDGMLAGAATAEYDPETGEGSLEWVQVHPECRRQGLGAVLVAALLGRLARMADFATVSGEVDNPAMPEALYRRCGFTGADVWHILRKSGEKVPEEI
ncbi:MAG: GNAT family N-acetyltransferase [Oscillospiraceae bacterium]|nr:GNAT family N-acetyltransferase [Oscillospiraceae bacterium]